MHAFLALILAAIPVGFLSHKPLPGEESRAHAVRPLVVTTTEFGNTVTKIGVVIVLASIIDVEPSSSMRASVVPVCVYPFSNSVSSQLHTSSVTSTWAVPSARVPELISTSELMSGVSAVDH